MDRVAGRRHRRRWPWVVLAVTLVLGAGFIAIWATTNRAQQVTLRQAESRLHLSRDSSGTRRPAQGVYEYAGSGTERLSFPPLSQSEGPTIPGTVSMQGANCWVLRLDYSTHHWQTFDFCLHGGDVWETGGVTWQLFSIGPVDVSTTSTFTCLAGTMWLPGDLVVGRSTTSRCTGKSTSVKGETLSLGPCTYMGEAMLTVGHRQILAAHFEQQRVDSGAQTGSERYDIWIAAKTGLLLRFRQDIRLVSSSPVGKVTYTQSGTLHLASLTPEV